MVSEWFDGITACCRHRAQDWDAYFRLSAFFTGYSLSFLRMAMALTCVQFLNHTHISYRIRRAHTRVPIVWIQDSRILTDASTDSFASTRAVCAPTIYRIHRKKRCESEGAVMASATTADCGRARPCLFTEYVWKERRLRHLYHNLRCRSGVIKGRFRSTSAYWWRIFSASPASLPFAECTRATL